MKVTSTGKYRSNGLSRTHVILPERRARRGFDHRRPVAAAAHQREPGLATGLQVFERIVR
jgi:hypothetical protein